ncbi:hypothetical protein [Microbacterium sp. NIBRBAC000506063]|nr:hypothetical protein [Microbacterium sp. NIBRBAC000506063]
MDCPSGDSYSTAIGGAIMTAAPSTATRRPVRSVGGAESSSSASPSIDSS